MLEPVVKMLTEDTLRQAFAEDKAVPDRRGVSTMRHWGMVVRRARPL